MTESGQHSFKDYLGGLQMVAENGAGKTNQEDKHDVLKSTQTVIHKD